MRQSFGGVVQPANLLSGAECGYVMKEDDGTICQTPHHEKTPTRYTGQLIFGVAGSYDPREYHSGRTEDDMASQWPLYQPGYEADQEEEGQAEEDDDELFGDDDETELEDGNRAAPIRDATGRRRDGALLVTSGARETHSRPTTTTTTPRMRRQTMIMCRRRRKGTLSKRVRPGRHRPDHQRRRRRRRRQQGSRPRGGSDDLGPARSHHHQEHHIIFDGSSSASSSSSLSALEEGNHGSPTYPLPRVVSRNGPPFSEELRHPVPSTSSFESLVHSSAFSGTHPNATSSPPSPATHRPPTNLEDLTHTLWQYFDLIQQFEKNVSASSHRSSSWASSSLAAAASSSMAAVTCAAPRPREEVVQCDWKNQASSETNFLTLGGHEELGRHDDDDDHHHCNFLYDQETERRQFWAWWAWWTYFHDMTTTTPDDDDDSDASKEERAASPISMESALAFSPHPRLLIQIPPSIPASAKEASTRVTPPLPPSRPEPGQGMPQQPRVIHCNAAFERLMSTTTNSPQPEPRGLLSETSSIPTLQQHFSSSPWPTNNPVFSRAQVRPVLSSSHGNYDHRQCRLSRYLLLEFDTTKSLSDKDPQVQLSAMVG